MEAPPNPTNLAHGAFTNRAIRRRLAKLNGGLGAAGKARGPYPLDPFIDARQTRAYELRAAGVSVRQIALQLQIDRGTAQLDISMEGLRRVQERRDDRRLMLEQSISVYERSIYQLESQVRQIQMQIETELSRADADGSPISPNRDALCKLWMSFVASEKGIIAARSRIDTLLGLDRVLEADSDGQVVDDPVTKMLAEMSPEQRAWIRAEAQRRRRERKVETARLAEASEPS